MSVFIREGMSREKGATMQVKQVFPYPIYSVEFYYLLKQDSYMEGRRYLLLLFEGGGGRCINPSIALIEI